MRGFLTALAVLVAWAGSAAAQTLPADAQFAYEWNVNGTPVTSSSLSVNAGSAFTLQVYLTQTAGSTNVLTSEGGLFGGSVRTTYGSTPGVIRVASVNDVVYNPQFNDTATSNPTRVANDNFAEFRAVSDLTQAAAPVAGRVLLGTFTYQVLGAENSSTQLTAANIPNTLSDTVTFTNFFDLDPRIGLSTITVIVQPVPEPVGLTLFAFTAAGGYYAARRRRQAAST